MKRVNSLIVWGIIGCGDVAEIKSGPAFQKSKDSELLAVMRRNGELAKDFSRRHNVPLWYDNVEELLKNQDINAVYIATPPSTHFEYAVQSLKAGKDVYIEKPMVLSEEEARKLCVEIENSGQKLVVAHYRRFLPLYIKIKELIETNAIGMINYVNINFLQPYNFNSKASWRLDPKISGGGYFHDLAPHQIDLMYHFFGDYIDAKGFSVNQSKKNEVVDTINGIINFKNGIQFHGIWSFCVTKFLEDDRCVINGEKGTIEFSFYKDFLKLNIEGKKEEYNFSNPENIQQPLIQETVNYFLGKRNNPCSVKEGEVVLAIINKFTKK
ncbi:Gfo/Idh/MocA family oxidoreductase [uncultured Maribacter sp.]|uniref:Gfo/Idh/MocA family protein n=1 Tax=uncultured Maribacter sp. TaxID=431308 RepID=UPI0026362FD9|nr:Gfo/Idh/MocA family oxidoreductase [uncultured Maribacter sp.]